MKKRPLTRKELKYYARMAAEAYVNDPVHSYATKNEKIRKISSAVGVVVFVGLFVVTVSYIVNASYSPFLYFRF